MEDSGYGLYATEEEFLRAKYGPTCRCGVRQKPKIALHGVDDGKCPRHPEEEE